MKIPSRTWMRILISLLLTTAISLAFLNRPLKYELELVECISYADSLRRLYYFDFDGNGRTEKVLAYQAVPGRYAMIVYEWNERIRNQFNIPGNIVSNANLFSYDIEQDGKKEIVAFTHIGDSLFLNLIRPFPESFSRIEKLYIPDCLTIQGEAKYAIHGYATEDMNDDGMMEFYFVISAGFTLKPRKVYAFDHANDTLYSSHEAGSAPRYEFRSSDIDHDGKKEFWGQVNAYDNFHNRPIPYSDSSGWLMIYDHELNYKFKPIRFEGSYTEVNCRAIETEKGTQLVVRKIIKGNHEDLHNELLLVTSSGEIEKQIRIEEPVNGDQTALLVHGSRILLHSQDGKILLYDGNLTRQRIIKKDWMKGTVVSPEHVTGLPNYYFFLSGDGVLSMCNKRFKLLAQQETTARVEGIPYIKSVSSEKAQSGLYINSVMGNCLFEMKENPTHILFLFYPLLIFLAIYTFTLIIQRWQSAQEQKKLALEKEMQRMQMTTLKSQMNPHFIFNALNSISSMYIKGDSERADSFLTRFSRMIREVVDSSDKVIVTLQEEMEFVRNYLELEKVRFGSSFSFAIDLPKELSSTPIPSMCIHSFVENSVKHAFPDKSRKMHIHITARALGGKAEVRVSDNGIGYGNSDVSGNRSGKGLQLVREIIANYNQLQNKKISFSCHNLEGPAKQITGSEVLILLEE